MNTTQDVYHAKKAFYWGFLLVFVALFLLIFSNPVEAGLLDDEYSKPPTKEATKTQQTNTPQQSNPTVQPGPGSPGFEDPTTSSPSPSKNDSKNDYTQSQNDSAWDRGDDDGGGSGLGSGPSKNDSKNDYTQSQNDGGSDSGSDGGSGLGRQPQKSTSEIIDNRVEEESEKQKGFLGSLRDSLKSAAVSWYSRVLDSIPLISKKPEPKPTDLTSALGLETDVKSSYIRVIDPVSPGIVTGDSGTGQGIPVPERPTTRKIDPITKGNIEILVAAEILDENGFIDVVYSDGNGNLHLTRDQVDAGARITVEYNCENGDGGCSALPYGYLAGAGQPSGTYVVETPRSGSQIVGVSAKDKYGNQAAKYISVVVDGTPQSTDFRLDPDFLENRDTKVVKTEEVVSDYTDNWTRNDPGSSYSSRDNDAPGMTYGDPLTLNNGIGGLMPPNTSGKKYPDGSDIENYLRDLETDPDSGVKKSTGITPPAPEQPPASPVPPQPTKDVPKYVDTDGFLDSDGGANKVGGGFWGNTVGKLAEATRGIVQNILPIGPTTRPNNKPTERADTTPIVTDVEDLSRYTTYTSVNEDGETVFYRPSTPGSMISITKSNLAIAEKELADAIAAGGDERGINEARQKVNEIKNILDNPKGEIFSDADYTTADQLVVTAIGNSRAAIVAKSTDISLPPPPAKIYSIDELRTLTSGMTKEEMSAFFTDLILQGYASAESRNLIEGIQQEPWGIITTDPKVPIYYPGLSPRDLARIAQATGLEIMTEAEADRVNDSPEAINLTPNPQPNETTTAADQFENMLANSRDIAQEKAEKCEGSCKGFVTGIGKDTTIGDDGRVQIQGWRNPATGEDIQPTYARHFPESDISEMTYWDYSHVTRMKGKDSGKVLSDEEFAALASEKASEVVPYRAYSQSEETKPETLTDRIASLPRDTAKTLGNIARFVADKFSPEPTTRSPKVEYSDEELDLMTRVVLAETDSIRNADGSINLEGVQAVGEVMKYRMLSRNHPDSLEEVIFEGADGDTRPKGLQFTAVGEDRRGPYLRESRGPMSPDYNEARERLREVLEGKAPPIAVDNEGRGVLNYGNIGAIMDGSSGASGSTKQAFGNMADDSDVLVIADADNPNDSHTFGTIFWGGIEPDRPLLTTIAEKVGGLVGWAARQVGITKIAERALPELEEASKIKTVEEATEVIAQRERDLVALEDKALRMHETLELAGEHDQLRTVVETAGAVTDELNTAIGRARAERDEMERIWLADVLSGRETLRPEVVGAVDSTYGAVERLETMREEALIAVANGDLISAKAIQGDADKYSTAVNTLMNAVSNTSISVADIAISHNHTGENKNGFAQMTNGTVFSVPGDGRPGRKHDGFDYGTNRGDPWVAAPVAGTITSCGDGGGLAGGTCSLVPDNPAKDCDGASTCVIQIMHVEGIVAPNTRVEAGQIIAHTGGDRSTLWGLVTILAEKQAGRELTPEERDLAAWEIYDKNNGVLTSELKAQFAAEGLSNAYSGNPNGEEITPPHPHIQIKWNDRVLRGSSESDKARLERIFGIEKGFLSSIDQEIPFPTLDDLIREAEVTSDKRAAIDARNAREILPSDSPILLEIEANAEKAISLMNDIRDTYTGEFQGVNIDGSGKGNAQVAKLAEQAQALADRNAELLAQAEAESALERINPRGTPAGNPPRTGIVGGIADAVTNGLGTLRDFFSGGSSSGGGAGSPSDDRRDDSGSDSPRGSDSGKGAEDNLVSVGVTDSKSGTILKEYNDLLSQLTPTQPVPNETLPEIVDDEDVVFTYIVSTKNEPTSAKTTLLAPNLNDRSYSYSLLADQLTDNDSANTIINNSADTKIIKAKANSFGIDEVESSSYQTRTSKNGLAEDKLIYTISTKDGDRVELQLPAVVDKETARITFANAGFVGDEYLQLISEADYAGEAKIEEEKGWFSRIWEIIKSTFTRDESPEEDYTNLPVEV